jgi:hypothetical protein
MTVKKSHIYFQSILPLSHILQLADIFCCRTQVYPILTHIYFSFAITHIMFLPPTPILGLNMCVTVEVWQRMLDASKLHVCGSLKIATKNVCVLLVQCLIQRSS